MTLALFRRGGCLKRPCNWPFHSAIFDITANGIREQELERFILTAEKLPEMVTDFDEALWGSFVDHLTINGKDDILFTMASGMEIKAKNTDKNRALLLRRKAFFTFWGLEKRNCVCYYMFTYHSICCRGGNADALEQY